MSKNSDVLVGFLLGMVAGGAVALLLAPEKGEVTRRKIREGVGDLYGKGKDWVGETEETVKEKVSGYADRAKERAKGAAESARHQLEAVKGAVAEGKEAYRRELSKEPDNA